MLPFESSRFYYVIRWAYRSSDVSKTRKLLNCDPILTFDEFVRIMVETDMKAVEAGLKGGV